MAGAALPEPTVKVNVAGPMMARPSEAVKMKRSVDAALPPS